MQPVPKVALQALRLERDLVIFDLETTGLDIRNERIVQLAAVKVHSREHHVEVFRKAAVLINPDGVAIHPKAFEKHGIHESRLQNCPRFKDLARDLQTFISGCDVCGYNIRQFDVPLLSEEFKRCKVQWPEPSTRPLDVCLLFPDKGSRTLGSAVAEFCHRRLDGAHGAMQDVLGTMDLLQELVEGKGLPSDVASLDDLCKADLGTPCGSMRLRPERAGSSKQVLYFIPSFMLGFIGVPKEYHGKNVVDVARTCTDFKANVRRMRSKAPAEMMEILDKVAAGDLTVATRDTQAQRQQQQQQRKHARGLQQQQQQGQGKRQQKEDGNDNEAQQQPGKRQHVRPKSR